MQSEMVEQSQRIIRLSVLILLYSTNSLMPKFSILQETLELRYYNKKLGRIP
nr:MAG TPA: hypothetical protein [Caudoviricetes sp.]